MKKDWIKERCMICGCDFKEGIMRESYEFACTKKKIYGQLRRELRKSPYSFARPDDNYRFCFDCVDKTKKKYQMRELVRNEK